jgi:CheY-like chemotaxis protein
LAIVHHLLELHNGSVSVESEGLGKGSSFTVTLPVIESMQIAVPPTKKTAGEKTDANGFLSNYRILLVEDDTDSREMLAAAFGLYGMNVMTAESAPEAMELMHTFRPEILISDVGLPGEDGFSLMRKIRALPAGEGSAIPAIALTGYVSLQDQATARQAGYQEHLAKPVDIEELADIVHKLLHGPVANSRVE